MSIELEKKTAVAMIELYCSSKHEADGLCDLCEQLREYALRRLDRCPYGDQKPQCKRCPVHCYSPEMRERIANVMRYAGPRMLLHHPILGIRHLLNRKAPEKQKPSR